jgi:alpha-tubulin suppressor-like RCC1 family protein
MAALAGIWVRSVAVGTFHSLALSLDGLVYSWGYNDSGQLGHGDKRDRTSPALLEGLEAVCGIASASCHSYAVIQSGGVFKWGDSVALRPVIVEGFGEVRVHRVCAGRCVDFAIGQNGDPFSFGCGIGGTLGHGDTQDQPSPKRVEALRGVRVSTVCVRVSHALALTEDGLVYTWGAIEQRVLSGNPHAINELLPKPVEALRGVRVGGIAASVRNSYAVTDTGELWAWGVDGARCNPLGHGTQRRCPLPKPIISLRVQGVKIDAVVAVEDRTQALADDGSVFEWGDAASSGAPSLGRSVMRRQKNVSQPRCVPDLRLPCGL